jgi:PAS domain S-box-containing protein
MRHLRTRLTAIILIVLLPAVAMFAWYATAERSWEDGRLRQDQAVRASLRGQILEQQLIDVRSELALAASIPNLQGDLPETRRVLGDAAKQEPLYSTMAVTDASGTVVASTVPTGAASIAGREWFARAMATGLPVVGGYETDPVSGRPSLPIAVPIVRGRRTTGVVFAACLLDVLRASFRQVTPSPGTVIVVMDHAGMVLTRIPGSAAYEGVMEDPSVRRAAEASGTTAVDARGIDGVVRRFEVRKVALDPSSPVYVLNGYDESVEFAPERQLMATGWSLLAAGGLLGLAVAYFASTLWVLRPVGHLASATARVAAGDLDARAGLDSGAEEFRSLGAQFDEMAAALKSRLAELRGSQRALGAERERLRTVIDEMPAGVALIDEKGGVLEVNAANERIWQGAPRPGSFEEYRGVYNVYDAVTGRLLEPNELPGARTLAEAQPVEGEFGFQRFDGSRGFIHISAVPIVAGDARWALVVTEDVTERSRHQTLSDALNRVDVVVHSSLDVDAIMQRSLDAGVEAAGVDAGTIEIREGDGWVVRYQQGLKPEAVGTRLEAPDAPIAAEVSRTRQPLVVPDMLADTVRNVGFIQATAVRATLALPLIVRDEVIGCLLLHETGKPREFTADEVDFGRRLAASISLALDNAALFGELDERVRQRTAELETANKELEAFSYSVSHDLRAPLRSIDGFSQALVEDFGDKLDAEALEHLGRVRAAAQRMGELIDALLSLSRVSRTGLDMREVDLSAVAEAAGNELRDREPDRCVEFEVERGLMVHADPTLMRVLLDNLLGNAWKFTRERECACIAFGLTATDSGPAYFVRDDGAGFDMAHANKLFSAFQRLHPQDQYPGIGIGLTTAARIVHRHGGRIWAEAELDRGATFYFTMG